MRHIISVLVENEAGALSRLVGLFSQRGYNIETLNVAPTEDPTLSRLTLTTYGDDHKIEQITKQLNKLVNVIKIVELAPEASVSREHVMIKVRADAATRLQVTQAADLFRASIIDVSPDSVVIEATGTSAKLKAFLEVMDSFGIRELVRSGTVALSRGPKTMAPAD